jgi:hypothetical protein
MAKPRSPGVICVPEEFTAVRDRVPPKPWQEHQAIIDEARAARKQREKENP